MKDFPENMQYYLESNPQIPVMQGDAIRDLAVINFDTGEKKSVRGIVMSNTCDTNLENYRDQQVRVIFAPLISVRTLEQFLHQLGKTKPQIDSRLASIRSQTTTSAFYLPGINSFDDGDVAFLDDLHTLPISFLVNQENELHLERITRLSMMGFYMFLMKIAIHFCRFQENVPRFI